MKESENLQDLLNNVRRYMAIGHFEDAETVLRHVMEVEPQNVSALILRGDAYKKKGDLNSAVETFRKVCEIEPKHEWARIKLALAYKELGRKEEARHQFGFLVNSSDYTISEAAKWHLDDLKPKKPRKVSAIQKLQRTFQTISNTVVDTLERWTSQVKETRCPGCGSDLNKFIFNVSGSLSTIRCPICGADITSLVTVIDLRSDEDKAIEREAQKDIGGQDERLARRICFLQRQKDSRGNITPHARTEIRRIGEYLGANGGNKRMSRVAYRVHALGGNMQQLPHLWEGICGWMP